MFKLQNQHDSAAYYIKKRAFRDTTNAGWQFDAAVYLYGQNQFQKAAPYYEKALEIYRYLSQSNPEAYERDVAMTLNNLAILLYMDTQRLAESEEMYKEALAIRRHLSQLNPDAHEPYVAQTVYNLAIMYQNTHRFAESEESYKEALEIYRRLFKSTPEAYESNVAMANLCLGIVK